jgi:ADP-heptose:LPS heptosyltransferase
MSAWKTIERRVRHGLARPLVRALARGVRPAEELDPGEVRRVLFVRPNARLGNLLLATPALSIARAVLPGAAIHLLTASRYRELLRGHAAVDRVVAFDRGMLLRPWSLAFLIRRLRTPRYDLVIDCSEGESLTGALLARFAGGRWRAAPGSSRYEALYNVRVSRRAEIEHRADRLAGLLEGLGIVGGPAGMTIALDARDRAWARDRWRELGLRDRDLVAGVNIGARGAKRWPMESFLEVIRRLHEERDARILVFAGPEDLDRLAAVEDRLPAGVIVDTTARVRRFAALLERCSLVITGDTGPMHLSAAVGTPTVSIFLQENHRMFAPRGARHRCLHGAAVVTPDDVLEAVSEVLADP